MEYFGGTWTGATHNFMPSGEGVLAGDDGSEYTGTLYPKHRVDQDSDVELGDYCGFGTYRTKEWIDKKYGADCWMHVGPYTASYDPRGGCGTDEKSDEFGVMTYQMHPRSSTSSTAAATGVL